MVRQIDKGYLDESKINKVFNYDDDEDENGRASDGLTDEERMERIRKLSAPEASSPTRENREQQQEGEEEHQEKQGLRAKLGFGSSSARRPSKANANINAAEPHSAVTAADKIGYVSLHLDSDCVNDC